MDILLWVDNDATYLIVPEAKSWIAGFYHLSEDPNKTNHPILNGPINIECLLLCQVVSLAVEAEIAGLFHNVKTAIQIQYILHQINHLQLPTKVKTDKTTVNSLIHNNNQQKQSKSWYMGYF